MQHAFYKNDTVSFVFVIKSTQHNLCFPLISFLVSSGSYLERCGEVDEDRELDEAAMANDPRATVSDLLPHTVAHSSPPHVYFHGRERGG